MREFLAYGVAPAPQLEAVRLPLMISRVSTLSIDPNDLS